MSQSQTLPASLWKRTLVSFLWGDKRGSDSINFYMKKFVSVFVVDSLCKTLYRK